MHPKLALFAMTFVLALCDHPAPQPAPTVAPTPTATIAPTASPSPVAAVVTATAAATPFDLFGSQGATAKDLARQIDAPRVTRSLSARRPESLQNDNGHGQLGVTFAFTGRTGVYIAAATLNLDTPLRAPASGMNVDYGPTIKVSTGCGELSFDTWTNADGSSFHGPRRYNVCTGEWTDLGGYTDDFRAKYVRLLNGSTLPGVTVISEFDPVLGQQTVLRNYRDGTWDTFILLDNTQDGHGGWVFALEPWWNNSPCPVIPPVQVLDIWIMQNGQPFQRGDASTLSPSESGACTDQATTVPRPWTNTFTVSSP